eukprot:scaffold161490_cov33-Prasinocladus_malaysianus.AAC.12
MLILFKINVPRVEMDTRAARGLVHGQRQLAGLTWAIVQMEKCVVLIEAKPPLTFMPDRSCQSQSPHPVQLEEYRNCSLSFSEPVGTGHPNWAELLLKLSEGVALMS